MENGKVSITVPQNSFRGSKCGASFRPQTHQSDSKELVAPQVDYCVTSPCRCLGHKVVLA